MIRLRRSQNCSWPGELGFTLMNGSLDENEKKNLSQDFQLSDRLLFNAGFYPALRQLAIDVAARYGLAPPLPETATLRPLWMGRTPAETPPPAQES